MSRYFRAGLIILFCLLLGSETFGTTYYTYTNGGSSGLWTAAGTWTTDPSGLSLTGSAVPSNNDVVYILNGFRVILNANVVTTGHSITINNGGTLDLATFTITTLNALSGSGILKIKAGYFPTITSNNFVSNSASGATVQYYDFTGTLPGAINYPNLTFSNTTGSAHDITFPNASAYSFTVFGNWITQNTGAGSLTVTLANAITNVINVTINGNTTIGANTSWRVGVFNAVHNITCLGNMTNNGTIDFSNSAQYAASANGAANLTFTGATDNTLACNGLTDLYTLTVNKGSGSANILSVTSTNVANLNLYSNGTLLNITYGTLRLGVNISLSRISGAGNYDLGFTDRSPMLWIDGATVNMNSSPLVVYGKFRITSGSFTSTGGEGTVIREEGQYIIEGGTFTTEKFRPSTTAATHRGSFIMTGGTFNASGTGSSDNYARFSLPYPEQVFIMSGGTINVSNPEEAGSAVNGGIHIGCNTSNYLVTGGTFNAILSGTAPFFDIASTAPFWNLIVSRTGGTPTTVRIRGISTGVSGTVSATQPLTVLNDLIIDGANNPVLNANAQNVSIGKNFTINTNATYTPNSNTTTFNGTTGDQDFINNGTITTGLYNLTVNKPSGAVILGGSALTYTVTQTLTLTSGILNDGGKTLQVSGNIYNAAIHTGTGNITLNGATTQTISGDGNGVFGNMILSNASTPGARATSALSVSGILTLAGTTSLFDIAENLLSLTSTSATALTTTGAGFSSSKMIRTSGFQSDAGVRKTYGNLSAFTFAFGTGTNYTPSTVQITSAPTSYGTITSRPVNSRHQFIVASNTNNLTWYWKVSSAGFTGLGATAVSHTYQYVEGSVAPAGDDVNYVPARYSPTSWTVISDLTRVDEATNVISFTGVAYIDGEFTAGIPVAFGTVKIFYSKRSGNWTDVGVGTTPWSNASHSGADATTAPVVGDQVYIGDGATFNHVITITTNGRASGGLEISAGSVLDVGVYTGHNFGTFENTQISGSGKLRISSATATAEFPAGDFGNFIRGSGGTVEYYTTGTTDFTIPVSSHTPTSLPLISYRHLMLTPGTGRFIMMPNQDERIYGNLIVQGTSATGVARLNSAVARTLTIDGDLSVTSGNLQFQNGTVQNIALDGNLNIGAGAIFDLAGTGTAVTNLFTIEGNIVNNGTLDFGNGSFICNATFTGNASTTITGTGATTDFNILNVSKGTSQATVLEVNASAFSLSGATLPLVLNSGTFRLTSAQTVTFASNTDFTIPANTRLSANGGTLQLAGGDGHDLLLAGTLEVLNGTVNVGTTASDNSVEYAATGQPTMTVSGGSLNIQSQVRRSFASTQGALIYNQSGGIVSVGIANALTITRGIFEILNTGSTFTTSGGTLRIMRASASTTIAELYMQPSTFTVTGGTIDIGNAATSYTIDINSAIPVYNVSVTGNTTTARLESAGLTLRGTLDIGSGNVFFANSFNVNIAGNFVNSNLSATTGIAAGGYRAGSLTQTTTFNSAVNNQTITGGVGNLTNFGNLVISNTFSGGVVGLQPNSNLYINGTLTLSNGTLGGAGNTITAISTVSNSATHTSSGSGSLILAGTGSQFVTGSGSGKFGNLTLNNAAGASFGATQEVTGNLTFTSGSLNIGPYGLKLTNTSLTAIVGANASRYIIGSGNLSDAGVTKTFAASVTAGNFVYPIGVSGKFTPANYTITTGGTGGTISITPVNSKHPSATGSGTAFIRYYWNVSSSAIVITALTHTYTYNAADEAGTTSNYRDARFGGGAWTVGITAGNPDITNRIITFTNTDLSGDYTAGEATAFVNPTTYTSIASGNWESDLSVWDIDPPGTNLGPPPGSFVIISVGHIVTVTTNARRTATLEVRGRLHLTATTGHDFGTVSTSGAGARTIRLQSSTFPAGNFTTFNAANGGTVEYNGTVVLPTQNVYNNLTFTSAGTKTLPNADLTINGNFTVSTGTATNAVNNRNILLVSSTGDFTNNAVFDAGSGVIVVGRHLVNSGVGANFVGGTGTAGLKVSGNLTNSSSATFTMSTDSLGVRGNFNNSATFAGSSGPIRVSQNFNNTGGTFTGGTGIVTVSGSLTNNAAFNAGAGATTVKGSYSNTGASAVHTANANALAITGNFTNSSSATFHAITGSISVDGNWNNSATFNSGTGSVVFNSASGQTLTGATTFNNFSRTGGGSLTLNNSISATGLLTLTSGNIITGSSIVTLTNTATQPVSGYSTSSFIDGKLAIGYPSAAGTGRVYPVGKGSLYRPVTIVQTAASSLPTVNVEMIDTPPTGTYPTSVGILSERRYYAIDVTSGTMVSPTIELNFNTNGAADEEVVTPGNVHIMRATSPGGPWTDEGGSGVFSPAAPAGYATSGVTTISNPTYFTLGYQNTALPISLRAFAAEMKSDVVELTWSTYSEENNDYFTIERSETGLHFDSIGFVQGAGNSSKVLFYKSLDTDPLQGVSYYRLKQTDLDLKYSYSNIVRITNSNAPKSALSVYPNPVTSAEPLYVKFDHEKNNRVYLQITSLTGVVHFSDYADLSSPLNVNNLNMRFNLGSGIYFISVSAGGFREMRKVVIR